MGELGARRPPHPQLREVLKRHREAHHLSVKELAAASGLTPYHLWHVERGIRSLGPGAIGRLSRVLGGRFAKEVLDLAAKEE
jgi:transcriptional regulator with XRE-family HTH domain